MKLKIQKIILSPLFWTIPVFIVVMSLLPSFFQKNNLKKVKTEFHLNERVYYEDLTGDGCEERIVTKNHFGKNSVILYDSNGKFVGEGGLENNFLSIDVLFYNDYDNDGKKEIYTLTQKNDSIFLLFFDYYRREKKLFKSIFITTIRKNYKGEYDPTADGIELIHDINGDGYNEIYFYISSGYSFFPRQIFACDLRNDSIYRSPLSGNNLFLPAAYDFEADGEPEIYCESYATGNTPKKFRHFSQLDTSAWLAVFDTKLNYKFAPKPFNTGGTLLKTQPLTEGDKSYIIAYHRSYVDEKFEAVIYIYTIEGELIKSRKKSEIAEEELHLMKHVPDRSYAYFINKKGVIYKLNSELKVVEKIDVLKLKVDADVRTKRLNINKDGLVEMIFTHNKTLTVTDADFKFITSISFDNATILHSQIIHKKNDGFFLWVKSANNIWYMLEYAKNKYYFYRYLIFIGVFVSIFVIIYLLMTLRSKAIEIENARLEKLIEKRTKELVVQRNKLDRLYQQLFSTNLELEDKNTKLEELDRFKQTLSTMVVHDLKNPLNLINAATNDKSIENSVSKMLFLIDDIISIYKLDEKIIQISYENINFSDIVNKVIRQVEYEFLQKNIRFVKKCEKHIAVRADAGLLERILINLLTNALKYTPNNGKITVSAVPENGQVKIAVQDSGMGINKENIKHILLKYKQINAKNYGIVESSGIGLTFCKMAVEAHQKTLFIQSESGKGSCFCFFLEKGIKKQEDSNFRISRKLELTADEKVLLQMPMSKLQKMEVFQATEIRQVLKQIKNKSGDENILKWLDLLEKSVYSCNEKNYKKLINN